MKRLKDISCFRVCGKRFGRYPRVFYRMDHGSDSRFANKRVSKRPFYRTFFGKAESGIGITPHKITKSTQMIHDHKDRFTRFAENFRESMSCGDIFFYVVINEMMIICFQPFLESVRREEKILKDFNLNRIIQEIIFEAYFSKKISAFLYLVKNS